MDWMHVLLLALLALALAGCGVLGALLRRTLRRTQLLRDALSEAGEGNLCRLISATGTARERKATLDRVLRAWCSATRGGSGSGGRARRCGRSGATCAR